jgi:hypothetical protein
MVDGPYQSAPKIERTLKGFLQRAIETPLSCQLGGGEITDHSRLTVEFKKGELVFEA